MTTTIKHMTAKADNRTRPDRQAAKALGVEVKSEMTEVHDIYGSNHAYTQAFWTKCGNVMVIDVDDDHVEAALCTSDLDWDHNPYDSSVNYRRIAEAAGLRLEREAD